MRDKAIEMAKRLITDSIWKSTNLEGLAMSYPKVTAMLENAPMTTTAEEVLFVFNMKQAWRFIFSSVGQPNSLNTLKEFNRIAGYMLIYMNGEIRDLPVIIGGTTWVPEMPQEDIFTNRIAELNSIEDPELRALKYFCFIARSQIFIDGNKRVAQLMANKILIENDIGIFQIDIDDLEEFKTLLVSFYESNDDTAIIDFMRQHCVKRCAVSYDEIQQP